MHTAVRWEAASCIIVASSCRDIESSVGGLGCFSMTVIMHNTSKFVSHYDPLSEWTPSKDTPHDPLTLTLPLT